MVAKSDYRFSLIDPRYTVTGEGLVEVMCSWSDVERWWRRPKSRNEILIGYIGYEQGYRFVEAPQTSVVWQAKPDVMCLPPVFFGRFRRARKDSTIPPRQIINAPLKLKSTLDQRTYAHLFATVQRHLRIGDIYQANVAYRLNAPYLGSAADAFWQLFDRQPVPYGAIIETPQFGIAADSPELFLRLAGQKVETRPMKGTRPRGRTTTLDVRAKTDLQNSSKEQAELAMIVDVHRNDLARTCLPGSVRVKRRRELLPYSTVWQAQARIVGQRHRGYSPLDTITTCFPAGSVTGAPKLRAMEIIHQLERYPRQVYCGAIGYIAAGGDAEFNVAIRTAQICAQQLYYYVGSGITVGSNLVDEWGELKQKYAALI